MFKRLFPITIFLLHFFFILYLITHNSEIKFYFNDTCNRGNFDYFFEYIPFFFLSCDQMAKVCQREFATRWAKPTDDRWGNGARILVHYCSLIRSSSIIVVKFITHYFMPRNRDKFYEGGS